MLVETKNFMSVILSYDFYQVCRASKKKAKYLKPDQVPKVILADSEESENDNI
jgi:hypothetical protein